jgi:hypothetical protein
MGFCYNSPKVKNNALNNDFGLVLTALHLPIGNNGLVQTDSVSCGLRLVFCVWMAPISARMKSMTMHVLFFSFLGKEQKLC